MANSNGFQTSVKKTADAVLGGDLSEAAHNAQMAARKVGSAASDAAVELAHGAKKHPVVAGVALFGVGALAGALLHSVLRPQPSAGEVLLRALKDGAHAAGDTLSSGMSAARKMIR